GTCSHSAPVTNCCATAADCNDGNTCTTDACVGNQCTHTAVTGLPPETDCNDMLDDDCDGLIDCDDPDCRPGVCLDGADAGGACGTVQSQEVCNFGGGTCSCPHIFQDPTKIKFGKTGQLDMLTSHGRVVIPGDTDVAGSPLAWLLTNRDGEIYRATLPAGSVAVLANGNFFKYQNKAAKTAGGVYKMTLKITRSKTSYGYKVQAYGDMSKATDAEMSLQFYLANQVTPAIHHETWIRQKTGWKTHVF